MVLKSILLGVGLAMDACAVSMANGLNDPKMKVKKIVIISFMFGIFQGMMPLLGYIIGSATIGKFAYVIPWISLLLLTILGVNMIIEGVKKDQDDEQVERLTFKIILLQAFATSIDAFSVGFTISDYTFIQALISVSLIAIITFIICVIGVFIGKKFGIKLGNIAQIFGGIILIVIGLEIFIKGIFF